MLFPSNTCVSFARRCALSVAVIGLSAGWVPGCLADDAANPAAAQAVPSGASVDTESGTITLIDQKNALVVVTVPGHDDLSFNVKDHRDVLNSIKVGDKLTMSYMEPYVTGLTPVGRSALTRLNRTVKVTQSSLGADQAHFNGLRVFSGVTAVTGIDRKLNLLTVEDKSGNVHSVRVSRPELVEVMKSLKHNSRVRIVYESETTVNISR